MSAREKIQSLTNAWYGYYLFAGAISLFQSGLGFFSIAITAITTIGLFVMTWFLGRRLLARSSFTRTVLNVISFCVAALSGYGVAKAGWMFVHEWSISLLIGILLGAGSIAMHVRSLRTLNDSSVKAYINS